MKWKITLLLFLISLTVFAEKTITEKPAEHIAVHFSGYINNDNKINFTLWFDNNKVSGHYYYLSQNKDIYLEGNLKNGTISLTESVYENDRILKTGYFEGLFKDGVFSGTWTNAEKTKSFPFYLKSLNKPQKEFSFETDIIKDSYIISVKKIRIYDNGKLSQEINLENVENESHYNIIYIQDINFDGYNDIYISSQTGGAAGNTTYLFWTYDENTGKFIDFKDIISNYSSPVFDPFKKLAYCFAKSGAAYHYRNTFQLISGHYYLIESVKEEPDKTNKYLIITVIKYKTINGKSVEISKTSDKKLLNN